MKEYAKIKKPVEQLDKVDPNNTWGDPTVTSLDKLKSWILIKLGAPLQTVELTDEQLDVVIGDAVQFLSEYEYHPEEYCVVNLCHYKPGLGIDLSELKIMSIKKISYARDNIMQGYGDLFFSPYAAFGQGVGSPMFGMGGQANFVGAFVTYHNIHEWYQMAERMMGTNPDFTYNKITKILKLMPEPRQTHLNQKILLTCHRELPIEQYYASDYCRRLALAHAKVLLGTIRRKFSNVQLPGGGSLDTQIGDEGKQELEKLQDEIIQCQSKGQFFCLS